MDALLHLISQGIVVVVGAGMGIGIIASIVLSFRR